jgi:hypothetical protein
MVASQSVVLTFTPPLRCLLRSLNFTANLTSFNTERPASSLGESLQDASARIKAAPSIAALFCGTSCIWSTCKWNLFLGRIPLGYEMRHLEVFFATAEAGSARFFPNFIFPGDHTHVDTIWRFSLHDHVGRDRSSSTDSTACPWRRPELQSKVRSGCHYHKSEPVLEDWHMSHAPKIALAAFVAALGGISDTAFAHGRLYPLTRCGPNLDDLCPIHGYFDQPPFHYNSAVYPGCIRVLSVQTPYGIERRRTIVCGAPERSMIWW